MTNRISADELATIARNAQQGDSTAMGHLRAMLSDAGYYSRGSHVYAPSHVHNGNGWKAVAARVAAGAASYAHDINKAMEKAEAEAAAEQTTPAGDEQYASPGAQLDAALAKHTATTEANRPELPPVEPAASAAEASLDAKLDTADVADPREIQRATGTVRNPEKFFDLDAPEVNALRGRTAPESGPVRAVIVHPGSGNAIVVGPFDSAAEAAAWWEPEFNRMRGDSLLITVAPAPAGPADLDKAVDNDRVPFERLGADLLRHRVTGVTISRERPGAVWKVTVPGGEPSTCGNPDTMIDNIMPAAITTVRSELVKAAARALGCGPWELTDPQREAARRGVPLDVDGTPIEVGSTVACIGDEYGVMTGRRGRVTASGIEMDGPGYAVIEIAPFRPGDETHSRSANRVRVVDKKLDAALKAGRAVGTAPIVTVQEVPDERRRAGQPAEGGMCELLDDLIADGATTDTDTGVADLLAALGFTQGPAGRWTIADPAPIEITRSAVEWFGWATGEEYPGGRELLGSYADPRALLNLIAGYVDGLADTVDELDGFAVGDLVRWASDGDAEPEWRIARIYVPRLASRREHPYAGLESLTNAGHGTAGRLSLLVKVDPNDKQADDELVNRAAGLTVAILSPDTGNGDGAAILIEGQEFGIPTRHEGGGTMFARRLGQTIAAAGYELADPDFAAAAVDTGSGRGWRIRLRGFEPVLDADGRPVPLPAPMHTAPLDLMRQLYAGRVAAPGCPHYMYRSEREAGIRTCEKRECVEADREQQASAELEPAALVGEVTDPRPPVAEVLTDGRGNGHAVVLHPAGTAAASVEPTDRELVAEAFRPLLDAAADAADPVRLSAVTSGKTILKINNPTPGGERHPAPCNFPDLMPCTCPTDGEYVATDELDELRAALAAVELHKPEGWDKYAYRTDDPEKVHRYRCAACGTNLPDGKGCATWQRFNAR